MQRCRDVIQAGNKVFTCYARHTESTFKSQMELLFNHTIHTFNLLLFAKLKPYSLRLPLLSLSDLSGSTALSVDRALIALAAISFKEQFFLFCSAKSADRTCISCHFLVFSLHAACFARAASVVRNRSYIRN
jgi:hypothetical protein